MTKKEKSTNKTTFKHKKDFDRIRRIMQNIIVINVHLTETVINTNDAMAKLVLEMAKLNNKLVQEEYENGKNHI